MGSGVQRFHSSLDYIWDAHLLPKRQLRRPIPKFGAKLAIIWNNELLYEEFGS